MKISIYDKAIIDTDELRFAQGKFGNADKILNLHFKNGSIQDINFYQTNICTEDAIKLINQAITEEHRIKHANELDLLELQDSLKVADEGIEYWRNECYKKRREHLTLKQKSERFTSKRTPSKKRLRAEISRLELLIENFEYNQKKYKNK